MELVANNEPLNMVQQETEIVNNGSSFIEANTETVTLEHLKEKCIIPVFSKDNETTISHYEFIQKTIEIVNKLFPDSDILKPEIKVSHIVKGRTPDAIGKPAKELLENEKTIYYERCAFLMEIKSVTKEVNGNMLSLSIGGVRAYNQENLYSTKSLEKFKVFIGFKNRVCTNLCVSTDGLFNDIRVGSILDLEDKITELVSTYNMERHLEIMGNMCDYALTENEFAHLIGKLKMYLSQQKAEQNFGFPITLNESQLSKVVKEYYNCENFKCSVDGSISFWNLYNLFTEANKSSYIDNNLERNVNVYVLVNNLAISLLNGTSNWLLSQ